MKITRILLPFTRDLDLGALEYAVRFAKKCRAILIPLALLPLSVQQWKQGPRLEAIEQAHDFLEAVRYKAIRAGVLLEPCDLQTRDVGQSIRLFAQEMMCKGILLFLQEEATVLLSPEVVNSLLEQTPCTCYLVRLQPTARTGPLSTLLKRWRPWRRPQQGQQAGSVPLQGPSVPGGVL